MRAPPDRAYRVLPATDDETVTLLDQADFQPVTVDRSAQEPTDQDAIASGLRPGYLVEADLTWPDDAGARFESLSVTEYTLFAFQRGVTGIFEVALDTWEDAQQSGKGVNSRVTYSNDGHPNGALYTFAAQPGGDLFDDFRTGRRPLTPLLDRIEEDPPYEVFVFDVASHPFVLIYIVLAKGSILADTVRDTYDVPRPTEPLLESDSAGEIT